MEDKNIQIREKSIIKLILKANLKKAERIKEQLTSLKADVPAVEVALSVKGSIDNSDI